MFVRENKKLGQAFANCCSFILCASISVPKIACRNNVHVIPNMFHEVEWVTNIIIIINTLSEHRDEKWAFILMKYLRVTLS